MENKIDPATLLMCDLETGICEIPAAESERGVNNDAASITVLPDGLAARLNSNDGTNENSTAVPPIVKTKDHESNRTEAE